MKKTYALMLAAVLAVTSVAGCSDTKISYTNNTTNTAAASGSWTEYFNAPDAVEDDFSYITLKNGNVRITDYKGEGCVFNIPAPEGDKIEDEVYDGYLAKIAALDALKIPATLHGKPVTEVDFSASTTIMPVVILPDTVTTFALNSSTEKVNIPAGYTNACASNIKISQSQIKYYKATSSGSVLTEVFIPEGITEIGEYAFSGCKNLTDVKLPSSVTAIGYGAFRDCKSLDGINLDGVTEIGDWAFNGCQSLSAVTLNAALPEIGTGAFNKTGLSEITVPASVKEIGENAFNDCVALTAINVDGGNSAYASADGVLFTKNMKTLIKYPNNKPGDYYEVPAGVKTIGASAFAASANLATVVVPKGVNTIGFGAFEGCSHLVSLTLPKSVSTCDWNASGVFANAFDNCSPNIWIVYGNRGFGKADIENDSIYLAINHIINP